MTAHRVGRVSVYVGDCVEVLRGFPDGSFDSVVTDPPYGLEFMGAEWDRPWAVGMSAPGYGDAERLARPAFGDNRNANCRACGGRQRGERRCSCAVPQWDRHPHEDMVAFQAWCVVWAVECMRVLKPGGYLLAFGGTRTWHRLTCAVEDAGFEIRDTITWLYGSGFPKSLNVSRAIDLAAGAEPVVIGPDQYRRARANRGTTSAIQPSYDKPRAAQGESVITAPATEDAARWDGWGTALKPASEPIVVARKPLAGTVAGNVLAYGTGALNIDATRVGTELITSHGGGKSSGRVLQQRASSLLPQEAGSNPHQGRWPSNVVLTHQPLLDDAGQVVGDACASGCVPGCPVAELDAQSGAVGAGGQASGATRTGRHESASRAGAFLGTDTAAPFYADEGGASRFFPTFRYQAKADTAQRPRAGTVAHPTVKPLDLMRWLARLVTQPGGRVLDLFAGSGTTGEACEVEGFDCDLIERQAEYVPLILDRLTRRVDPVAHLTAKAGRAEDVDLGLFGLL